MPKMKQSIFVGLARSSHMDWLKQYESCMAQAGFAHVMTEKVFGQLPSGQVVPFSLDEIFLDDLAGAQTDDFENAVYRKKKGVCLASDGEPFFEQYVELRVFDLDRLRGLYVARMRTFNEESELSWVLSGEEAQVRAVQVQDVDWAVIDTVSRERYSPQFVVDQLVRLLGAFYGNVEPRA